MFLLNGERACTILNRLLVHPIGETGDGRLIIERCHNEIGLGPGEETLLIGLTNVETSLHRDVAVDAAKDGCEMAIPFGRIVLPREVAF